MGMSDRKYTKEHEWVQIEGGVAIVGISHFAQAELGDLVFVDLPAVGKSVKKGETLCVVESTKAASDVYAPVSGVVKEVNTDLKDKPELINSAPYQGGWIAKLENAAESEIGELMNEEDYIKHIGE